ncbi:MAG: HAMP domain-containing histidine kinase [Planctomycetes bacterium]|jgi:two-component system phosphate regulon sensor histidine kinase PhoR|nr:HAMP domain-containing histidine kinase [Planctomycetota bacterium]
MMSRKKAFVLYASSAAFVVALLAWWAFFFGRQGTLLANRMQQAGTPLTDEQIAALQAVAAESQKMFIAEGGTLCVLLLGGMWSILRTMTRELALERQQKNFLSAITHELRSPIASARLYVESVLLGRADGEKRDRYLQRVMLDLDRLRTRVDDLLETARVNSSKPSLDLEPADLSRIARDVVDRLSKEHAVRGAKIELEAASGVFVRTDTRALDTVISNLVSNAVKYGGKDPRVVVRTEHTHSKALLFVRDYGPGLSGADPKRIFEPFVRGDDDNVRAKGGVGLGLYLVRELVTAMGGRVRAKDGLEGGGTQIEIELALAESKA